MLWFNISSLLPSSSYICDFNTSYVVVQLCMYGEKIVFLNNFNTSYVVVQHAKAIGCLEKYFISIHLMLWFNFLKEVLMCAFTDFNTSYVVVQH